MIWAIHLSDMAARFPLTIVCEIAAASKATANRITDLDRVQPHQVERKRVALARLVGLALRRQPLPRYRGFRLAANAWSGKGVVWANLIGTLRRVKRGANREDLRPDDSGR